MSDTVTNIDPNVNESNQALIRDLEFFLREAKAGRVTALVGAAVMQLDDGTHSEANFQYAPNQAFHLRLVGAMRMLEHRLVDQVSVVPQ